MSSFSNRHEVDLTCLKVIIAGIQIWQTKMFFAPEKSLEFGMSKKD